MRVPYPAPAFFRRRPLLFAALAFLAGLWASASVPYAAALWSVPAALLAVAILLRRVRGPALCLMALGLFSLGVLRGGMERLVPALPEMGAWQAEGTLSGAVTRSDRAAMFTLTHVRVIGEDGTETSIASNLYCYDATGAAARFSHGQRVSVRGTAYLPEPARNPGGFDQKMWLAQSGSHVRLYMARGPSLLEDAAPSLRRFAIQASRALGEATDRAFGTASPVIRSLLLGDTSDMPDAWYDWFREGGIVHLLAVSGLHVGLWFVLLSALLSPFPLSPRARLLTLAALLSAYALLTGLRASTLRAVLTLLMARGAQIAGRKYDPLTGLSAAADCILLVRPLDLFGPGFQLSFLAVLGLTLLEKPLARAMRAREGGVARLFAATLGAQAGTLPMCARWYGTVSPIGIPLNLLAVPVAGLLVPCAALGLLLSVIWPPLSILPVMAARGMVAALLFLSRFAARLPWSTAAIGAFSPWMLAAYLGCLFLCSSAVVWPRLARLSAMALLVAGAVAIGALRGDFLPRYVQLDVGQALSGVLHTGGKTYVYDCGDADSDLTEYLRYTAGTVEGLFLSHPHADHIRGLSELLDAGIPIKTVYVPARAAAFGADGAYAALLARAQSLGSALVSLSKGDTLAIPGGQISVAAPPAQPLTGSDPNDRSLALYITLGPHTLLLTGDADGAAEPLGLDCDILQVAHHGSRDAARPAFLRDATPEIALLSYGQNSYGHPAAETTERLRQAGATLYATKDTGAITLYLGQPLRVEVFVDDTR